MLVVVSRTYEEAQSGYKSRPFEDGCLTNYFMTSCIHFSSEYLVWAMGDYKVPLI
jgi:hypothetical protein